jgi:hypothetical protein
MKITGWDTSAITDEQIEFMRVYVSQVVVSDSGFYVSWSDTSRDDELSGESKGSTLFSALKKAVKEHTAETKRVERAYELEVREYRETLERVPDDIMLALGSRDFNMHSTDACVAGWALRESLSRLGGIRTAEQIELQDTRDVPLLCASIYGGDEEEWENIFNGVADERLPLIERAFIDRMLKIVSDA